MRPLLLIDPKASPDDILAWSQYGAAQALDMLGVSYEPATADEARSRGEVPLLIVPAQGLATRVPAAEIAPPEPLGAPADLLAPEAVRVTANPGGPSLPLLGPPWTDGEEAFHLERDGGRLRCRAAPHTFATLGLYLSRFSWDGSPVTDGGFVREIDALWDQGLSARWGHVAVVDEYLLLLDQALMALYADLGVPYARKWPHPVCGGRVCTQGLILSHDVDAVYDSDRFQAAGKDPSQAPDSDALRPASQAGNQWFNFPRWADLETGLGVKSVFFLMSPDPSLEYWCSPGYSIADPVVTRAAWRLAQLGWEVSIHQLGVDRPELLDGERRWFRQAMGVPPTGTRSHYLRHLPHTLALKAAAGHAYDSTWYAETTETSFLCGTTKPFGPFGLAAFGEPTRLWEFPFVIEDGIIFGVYGDAPRSVEGAVENGKRGLAQALRHNGYVCLNAHQRTFAHMSAYPGSPDDWTPAYEQLIREYQAQSPCLWSPLPRELASWWSARQRVRLESTPDALLVTNGGRAPVGDLVICRDPGPAGPEWQPLTDGSGREWVVRPTGLLRPGEARTCPW